MEIMDTINFNVSKTNLYEQVADSLEKAIISSSTNAEKLPSEDELSRQFKVSRTVTREALKVLKERGLITSRNGEGSFITKPKSDAIYNVINRFVKMESVSDNELYNMRLILECAGVRLAALNITPDEIEHLEKVAEKLCEKGITTEKRLLYDSDYHISIAKASGNHLLWMFVEVMTALLEEYMIKGLPHPEYIKKSIKEHKKVVDSLKKGDPDKAEAAMREHLNATWKNIEIYKKEHLRLPQLSRDPQ
jgi:GntR family transcriptional repressor for pyruvate dehydrogenase complex